MHGADCGLFQSAVQMALSSYRGSRDILLSVSLVLYIGRDCNRPEGHTPVFHRMQPACPRFLLYSSQQPRFPYQNIWND